MSKNPLDILDKENAKKVLKDQTDDEKRKIFCSVRKELIKFKIT